MLKNLILHFFTPLYLSNKQHFVKVVTGRYRTRVAHYLKWTHFVLLEPRNSNECRTRCVAPCSWLQGAKGKKKFCKNICGQCFGSTCNLCGSGFIVFRQYGSGSRNQVKRSNESFIKYKIFIHSLSFWSLIKILFWKYLHFRMLDPDPLFDSDPDPKHSICTLGNLVYRKEESLHMGQFICIEICITIWAKFWHCYCWHRVNIYSHINCVWRCIESALGSMWIRIQIKHFSTIQMQTFFEQKNSFILFFANYWYY